MWKTDIAQLPSKCYTNIIKRTSEYDINNTDDWTESLKHGGGKYEKYFKYIVTYNLSSFYCGRHDAHSAGSNYAEPCVRNNDTAYRWYLRYHQIHCT